VFEIEEGDVKYVLAFENQLGTGVIPFAIELK